MSHQFATFSLSLVVMILIGLGTSAQAQHRLRMTRVKLCYWNEVNQIWSDWPEEWTYFERGHEPVVKFTQLDSKGEYFLIETWVGEDYSSFRMTSNGYNSTKEWFEYQDATGDEITIRGANMSDLAASGWPQGKTVEIYFWIYSDKVGMVMI